MLHLILVSIKNEHDSSIVLEKGKMNIGELFFII